MIKGRAVTNLDGNFKKEYPEHVFHTSRDEKGTWFVTRAGPRYLNVYEVTEFDEAGEKVLLEAEQKL